jgi:hypothetical protein
MIEITGTELPGYTNKGKNHVVIFKLKFQIDPEPCLLANKCHQPPKVVQRWTRRTRLLLSVPYFDSIQQRRSKNINSFYVSMNFSYTDVCFRPAFHVHVLDKLHDPFEKFLGHSLMVRMRLLIPEGARHKDSAEVPDCDPRFEFITIHMGMGTGV